MQPFFEFINDKQAIVKTNYWDSEYASLGKIYLSWNAGAGRLLIPDVLEQSISELRGAKYVVISRGPWPETGKQDALEIMFEDGSDSPFCFHIGSEQGDRLLPITDQGGGFDITVWTREGEQLRLPAKYRVVKAIPCLQVWQEH